MPDESTPRPAATMRPAVAVELPPVARLALREVRRALIDRPDSAYDVLSTAMVVLAERQMLITPDVAAGIASTAYADGIGRAAELVAENTGNPIDANAQMLRRQAADVESGKVTPAYGGGITQTDAAGDVARCRLCGCTEAHACEGGCVWVANDLMVDVCSACVPAGPDVVRMTWEQRVTLFPGVTDGTPAEVPMRTAAGVPAVVGLTDTERRRLGSMLTLHGPGPTPCPTPRCGITDEALRESIPELGVPLYSWISVQVHGAEAPAAWYCSPWCAGEAIRRGGEQLAAADAAAATATAGPASYAEDLDERYGPGAHDEYAAQVGEATAEGFAEERVYDPAHGEALAEALAGDGVVYDASDFPADVDDADYPDDGGAR